MVKREQGTIRDVISDCLASELKESECLAPEWNHLSDPTLTLSAVGPFALGTLIR